MLSWLKSKLARSTPAASTAAPVGARPMHARMSYDAARSGTDLDSHWSFADALDADSANSQGVRQRLTQRSRYESGSNGYYAGILRTHCDMLVGTGPTLRMLTGNREFNQAVEREFFAWATRVQLRRKLRCMAYARFGDGESFTLLQTNWKYSGQRVALDLLPIEAEQCQSPYASGLERGYIDGVKFDENNNVEWYDILPDHPGSNNRWLTANPKRVAPHEVLHWYKLERPGQHRGTPELTPTLNVGASSRRWREATVTAAETAASVGAILKTNQAAANSDEPDPMAPFTSVEFTRRMLMALPMGWDATQMRSEHPNAEYSDFNRAQISEQASPLGMPFNLAAKDSSTYSFASGKLDFLGYRVALDVERQDCNDLVLAPLFTAWFAEWRLGAQAAAFEIENIRIPLHQWDWPTHPVIDAVAEANATDTKLKNGTITLRQVYSDQGKDLEDELSVMAEDMFGVADDATIEQARQILVLKNTPAHAIQYVAAVMDIKLPTAPAQGEPANAA